MGCDNDDMGDMVTAPGCDTDIDDDDKECRGDDVTRLRLSLLVLAKQIRHLPPNRGLWLASRSLPHSEKFRDVNNF